jgi:hypothetical protein
MRKFNIGDLVVGNAEASIRYLHTIERWVGVVYGYGNHPDTILVESPLKSDDPAANNFSVSSKYFEHYQLFPEDVPDTDNHLIKQ